MKIEGSVRNIQTHAAGVIISKDPLDNSVPIQRPPVSDDDAPPLTQYEMFALADLGLLKKWISWDYQTLQLLIKLSK